MLNRRQQFGRLIIIAVLFLVLLGTTKITADTSQGDRIQPLIKIRSLSNIPPDTMVEISITLEDHIYEMGGFDFLISYDYSGLNFMSAAMGQLLTDCAWEYFTYRFVATGLLRVTSIADVNNGPYYPSCYGPPDDDPHELARMTFYVNSEVTPGQQLLLYFFWDDCGDNAVSSVDGDTLYVSDHVYDFEGTEITDSTYGFPTYFGVQSECFPGAPEDPAPIQFIDFQGGAVYIYGTCCDLPGDFNNGGTVNILDITDLIAYLYYGGAAPPCMYEGDANGDCLINILDITELIDYLYDGANPVCAGYCPGW